MDRKCQYGSEVAALATMLTLLAIYLLLRYGALWGETDASANTQAIQAMLESGSLTHSSFIYPNGYGYAALSVFLIQATGITTSQFQLVLQLFLMAWIALPAWLLYRELTGSGRGATLATAILLVQPEFLFFLLRGTHEKFTRGLIMLALFLFVKSLAQTHATSRLAGCILAFYLTVYAVISFNNLIAFSLVAALLLALALLAAQRLLTRSHTPTGMAAERRLRYAVLIAGVLVFLFTFYFYPPARHGLLVLETMLDRTAALVLDVEYSSGANPYAAPAGAWISGPVYLALSIANWILLFVSVVIWSWQSLKLVLRRDLNWSSGQLLLWALFGAFTIQEGLSILVDLSGALSANLQVRAFPAFVMLAAPVAARAMISWQDSGLRFRRTTWIAMTALLSVVAALSVLKATNEPLVSNKWAFYIPAEMQALDRAGVILHNRTVWTEFDERLLGGRILRDPAGMPNKDLVAWNQVAPNVLVSNIIRYRGERIYMAPPVEADSLLIYDNGQAQLYHLRPRTPFQR